MAAAIIPANIGALEASNLAAAAAVHAATGGLALALVRRLRGLAWCAVGLLVYPRRGAIPPIHNHQPLVVIDAGERPLLISARTGGWTAGERLVRAAARARYTHVVVWTSADREAEWRRLARPKIAVVATHDGDAWERYFGAFNPSTTLTVLAPGVVASPALLDSARTVEPIGTSNRAIAELASGDGYPHSGVFRVRLAEAIRPDRLADHLRPTGEASMPPGQEVAAGRAMLSMRISSADEAIVSEHRLRASIFKPTDGRLARLNRRISVPISVAMIRWFRFDPSVMSVALTCLGLYAAWLFGRGGYATSIVAALLSWVASMLDGCDGELARLQYKESAFGCWLDTIGDYLYYVALFTGITVGVLRASGWPGFLWIGVALGAGMLLTFALLILLRWRITDGRPEQLRVRARRHIDGNGKRWTRLIAELDTCATRATMPYGIVVLALLDMLPALLMLAAFAAQVYWITLAAELGSLLHDRHAPRQPVSETKPSVSRAL
jgi:phosphatidylglycerophosphate synthase